MKQPIAHFAIGHKLQPGRNIYIVANLECDRTTKLPSELRSQ